MSQSHWTRRRFLAASTITAAAPMIVPARVFSDQSPSKRITLGFVGMGSQGVGNNLRNFLQQKDAQVLAVCDVFTDRAEKARGMVDKQYSTTGCKSLTDFRHIIDDKSIDAVVISTPDHWHVPMSLLALAAGKDVFCEKPTLTIAEGRTLVDAVKKHNAVFQIGLEDRSLVHYHKLAQAVRNGQIGKLHTITVGLPAGRVVPKEAAAPVPDNLHWNLWLGPAPRCEYSPSRTQAMVWRQVRDYSGGMMTDWGSHLVDTAQVASENENTGPIEIEGAGEKPTDALTDTFVKFDVNFRYANGVTMRVQSTGPSIRLDGDKGWVGNNGWRGPLQAHDPQVFRAEYTSDKDRLWPMPPSEHRNFLDCVKSRKPTMYTAEALQRLSTTLHLGNIALERGRMLKWNPDNESFTNDDTANTMRSRETHNDWGKG